MYEINPVLALSQTSVATNMVLTSSTNVFTADQHIAALEFALRNPKRTFDGVQILKPADNPNTTQTQECTKDKYNAKIRKQRVSPKVLPTTYKGQRIKK
jgi:hypothetical protein